MLGSPAVSAVPEYPRESGSVTDLDAELAAFPRLLAPMRPLLEPQASALDLHLDTDAYVTGLLLGDVAVLWGLSWESWGFEGARHPGLEAAPFNGVDPSDPPLDVFPEP